MKRNTKILCPVCERLVTLDGTTDGNGELIMPWHIRENFKRCEGSYHTPDAAQILTRRPGIR